MIEAFGSDATRARKADWVELTLLFSGRESITDGRVLRSTVALDDSDHATLPDEDDPAGAHYDEEILERGSDAVREDLWNEFVHRQEALGDLYPFKVTALGTGWKLSVRQSGTSRIETARRAYLASLVMAAFRHGHIGKRASAEATFKGLVKRIPEAFQGLAVMAAGNILDQVYWFGWPRKDASGFLAALADLQLAIGLGVLRQPPSVASVNMKDGTIDLVAWRTFAGGPYGSLILYGQVASGKNWTSKPLKAHIGGKFLHHFFDHPSDQILTSIFIPFLAHDELTFPKGTPVDQALADHTMALEKDYGLVVDRLRLTELVGAGAGAADKRHNCPTFDDVVLDLDALLAETQAYLDTN